MTGPALAGANPAAGRGARAPGTQRWSGPCLVPTQRRS
jgi:hypothetical protein